MSGRWREWIVQKNKRENDSYKNLKILLGILAISLPLVCIIGGALSPWHEIQISISHTYHTNLRDVMVGLLACVAIVFVSSSGYGLIDTIVTTVIGLAAAGVVLFPCPINPLSSANVAVAQAVTTITGGDPGKVVQAASELPVGIFLINQNAIGIPHLLCSGAFFILLAVNSIFIFTITTPQSWNPKKKMRNIIYIVCGCVILACMALLVIVYLAAPDVMARTHLGFICESIMLWAFGFAWLVKGGLIGFRNKKPA